MNIIQLWNHDQYLIINKSYDNSRNHTGCYNIQRYSLYTSTLINDIEIMININVKMCFLNKLLDDMKKVTLFVPSILAPLASSLSTTSEWPLKLEIKRGVTPSYNNNEQKICYYDNVDKFKMWFYELAMMMLCSYIIGITAIQYALSINRSIEKSIRQLMK
jgi:hypothetical protein